MQFIIQPIEGDLIWDNDSNGPKGNQPPDVTDTPACITITVGLVRTDKRSNSGVVIKFLSLFGTELGGTSASEGIKNKRPIKSLTLVACQIRFCLSVNLEEPGSSHRKENFTRSQSRVLHPWVLPCISCENTITQPVCQHTAVGRLPITAWIPPVWVFNGWLQHLLPAFSHNFKGSRFEKRHRTRKAVWWNLDWWHSRSSRMRLVVVLQCCNSASA